MKKIYIALFSVGVLFLYILFINFYYNYSVYSVSNSEGNLFLNNLYDEKNLNLNLADRVDMFVTRPRFYGRIEEFSYNGNKMRILYLFNVFKTPIQVGETNFVNIHLIALISISFVFLIWFLNHRTRSIIIDSASKEHKPKN